MDLPKGFGQPPSKFSLKQEGPKHIYVCVYIYICACINTFFIFFSTMVYLRILNIVPSAIQ